MPDSKGEENARIGNLLPLEKRLNERCDNKTLSEKLKIYEESSFRSVKKFLETRQRKPDFNLEERTNRLAELFYKEILYK